LILQKLLAKSPRLEARLELLELAVGPLLPRHGDAGHRAGGGAEIAGNTALLPVRVPGEDEPGPGAPREGPLIFRLLFGDRAAEKMPEHDDKGIC
jgi:hypothetical protein